MVENQSFKEFHTFHRNCVIVTFYVVFIHLSINYLTFFILLMKLKCVFVLSHCVALKRSFHYSKPPFLHKDLCCRCLPGSHLLSWLDTSCPSQMWCYISNSAKHGLKKPSHPAGGFSAWSWETCMQPAGGWRDEWVKQLLVFCSEWIRPCLCFSQIKWLLSYSILLIMADSSPLRACLLPGVLVGLLWCLFTHLCSERYRSEL